MVLTTANGGNDFYLITGFQAVTSVRAPRYDFLIDLDCNSLITNGQVDDQAGQGMAMRDLERITV